MLTIDADAHVIETQRTWDFLDPADRKYRPTLVAPKDGSNRETWVIDWKVRGFRFPTLTEQEMRRRSELSGRDVVTPQASREMDDVGLRLEDIDRLGIDIQVLHNTTCIQQLTDHPEIDVAARGIVGWPTSGSRAMDACAGRCCRRSSGFRTLWMRSAWQRGTPSPYACAHHDAGQGSAAGGERQAVLWGGCLNTSNPIPLRGVISS